MFICSDRVIRSFETLTGLRFSVDSWSRRSNLPLWVHLHLFICGAVYGLSHWHYDPVNDVAVIQCHSSPVGLLSFIYLLCSYCSNSNSAPAADCALSTPWLMPCTCYVYMSLPS